MAKEPEVKDTVVTPAAEPDYAAIIAELSARLTETESELKRQSGAIQKDIPTEPLVKVQRPTISGNVVTGMQYAHLVAEPWEMVE
jgi:hypothetical protein